MTPMEALENLLDHATEQGSFADPKGTDMLRAILRRDWAVRVLDAWHAAAMAPRKRAYEFDERGHLYICEWQPFARQGQIRDQYDGSPDEARLAAAKAVYPTLPDSVRAQLGEAP